MVSLLEDMARCLGHGAGPSGHQTRVDCVNCIRRLAPRAGYVVFMEPPKEFPCPQRIASQRRQPGDEAPDINQWSLSA